MRSELKTSVMREIYICSTALLAVALILFFAKKSAFGIFIGVAALAILTFSLLRGLSLLFRLAKGPLFFENKKIIVVPGGNMRVPLPKQDLNVWLSISGPIGRLKGPVECVTDKGSRLEYFHIEDYKRTSRSGRGSIIRSFSLHNAVGDEPVNFLNINLDFRPRSDETLDDFPVTVLATLQKL